MKLKDMLDNLDSIKPNNTDEKIKIGWLNEIEHTIFYDILNKAADNTAVLIIYKKDDNNNTELLAPVAYTDIYRYYLSAKIDETNAEIASYNNNMSLYNSMLEAFAAFWRRNHLPKNTVRWGGY